jgi:hypothetical protein
MSVPAQRILAFWMSSKCTILTMNLPLESAGGVELGVSVAVLGASVAVLGASVAVLGASVGELVTTPPPPPATSCIHGMNSSIEWNLRMLLSSRSVHSLSFTRIPATALFWQTTGDPKEALQVVWLEEGKFEQNICRNCVWQSWGFMMEIKSRRELTAAPPQPKRLQVLARRSPEDKNPRDLN